MRALKQGNSSPLCGSKKMPYKETMPLTINNRTKVARQFGSGFILLTRLIDFVKQY